MVVKHQDLSRNPPYPVRAVLHLSDNDHNLKSNEPLWFKNNISWGGLLSGVPARAPNPPGQHPADQLPLVVTVTRPVLLHVLVEVISQQVAAVSGIHFCHLESNKTWHPLNKNIKKHSWDNDGNNWTFSVNVLQNPFKALKQLLSKIQQDFSYCHLYI